MAYLDQKEIANFLAQELFYQQFITLEGLNSGVPTRTTPTLTPTTLRNIEQTFIELQSPITHENEAGFVPPLVHSIGNNQYISASDADMYSTKSQSMWQNSLSQSSSDSNTRSTPPPSVPLSQKTSLINNTPNSNSRRNMGGRKPAKDVNISPEEEERRRIRRERNKAAAARCRKRRVDHTNALIIETEELEQKKQAIQNELHDLRMIKEELEHVLSKHCNSPDCRLPPASPPDIKPFVNAPPVTTATTTTTSLYDNKLISNKIVKRELLNEPSNTIHIVTTANSLMTQELDDSIDQPFSLPAKRVMLSSTVPIIKPSRPNSLNVGVTISSGNRNNNSNNSNNNVSELAGIPITTPSSGMQFNFDSLMVGGTGLTPVSGPLVPSCSTQQRNIPVSASDIISPDACGPPKLVSL